VLILHKGGHRSQLVALRSAICCDSGQLRLRCSLTLWQSLRTTLSRFPRFSPLYLLIIRRSRVFLLVIVTFRFVVLLRSLRQQDQLLTELTTPRRNVRRAHRRASGRQSRRFRHSSSQLRVQGMFSGGRASMLGRTRARHRPTLRGRDIGSILQDMVNGNDATSALALRRGTVRCGRSIARVGDLLAAVSTVNSTRVVENTRD
jgi:hypothetical protein